LPHERNVDLRVFAGVANGGMQDPAEVWDVAGDMALGITRDLRDAERLERLARILRDG
jgi:hypothetical protein